MSVSPTSDDLSRPRRTRARAELQGVVQGVGFRPYVYQLATSLELDGFVRNDSRGVVVEVEGPPDRVRSFLERLPEEVPPLADVDRFAITALPPEGAADFRIVPSEAVEGVSALVTPDTATCDDCLAELFDPGDRRYRYPFTNCTNCGPRFTIVRGVPYDRPLTTMASFEMCEACRREYEDPADRRFHAQPNACPACGPSVRLEGPEGARAALGDARDPIEAAAAHLVRGSILGVKGLGGFHLACVAGAEDAVAELRRRKHRYEKPFALMVSGLESARGLVRLTPRAEELLSAREAPIVLAPRRSERGTDGTVASAVAPGLGELGLMLPYTPLHHLLMADVGVPLVMTSGNLSDEPIAYRDGEARERLDGVADLFLFHDRPIETRTDDSVVRVVSLPDGDVPTPLRRSRGYVPTPLTLPTAVDRPLLACGAHLKNTFCVAKGDRAWVSHHIGDLENYETLRSFREGITHFESLFDVEPELAVHDLHPGYLSTRYATDDRGLATLGVQHHHAHFAACLAEHRHEGSAIGVIYDGTGYGTDGTVWGGELLVGDSVGFQRAGHLWPVRLPGGEAAIREPWRMAAAWLLEAELDVSAPPATLASEVEPERWTAVVGLARQGTASPVTTSMGRLFDAVSALSGVRARVAYEGQAAIELEMAARAVASAEPYPCPVVRGGPEDRPLLDARALVRAVVDDLGRGASTAHVGARFHRGMAEATVRLCASIAREQSVGTVALSGGVFQNRLLLELVPALLEQAGLRTLVPRRLPVNDGGISYGQAAVAASRMREE